MCNLPAGAIGIEGTDGAVAAGFVADLVVLDHDPLADLKNPDSVYLVIKGGKLYKQLYQMRIKYLLSI
jgi:imidazolonepropionase-like amidohydrolase